MSDAGWGPHIEELLDDAPCGLLITERDGTIVRANRTLLEWVQRTAPPARFQDLLTMPGRVFYENQYVPLLRVRGFVREVAFDLRRGNDDPLPVLVSSRQGVDEAGRPAAVTSVVFDATDRRSYEREIQLARRSAERLAAIVASASDAILTASPDGTIQTWNPGAERMLGHRANDVVGRDLSLVLPDLDSGARAPILDALRTAGTLEREMIAVGADGRGVDVSVGLTAQMGLLGELAAVSLIVRDISARIWAEREVARQRDVFLATLSHDLKTPLTVIDGYTRLLASAAALGALAPGTAVTHIERSTRRMAGLLDELLDLARVRMGGSAQLKRTDVDLVALVRQVVADRQAEADRHRIDVEALEPHVVGWWDPRRLTRVLDNLIANAVKYSPAGGDVLVQVGIEVDGRGEGTRSAVVTVSDHGIGIPALDLPRLFEPFARASNVDAFAGTGIGLASVLRSVEEHGGAVAIESTEGTGTTVTVRLPLATS